MAGNGIQLGVWGGKRGLNPWTFIPDGRISQIRICAVSCIDSIQFTYIDHDGIVKHSYPYGSRGGSPHTITFADDEYLIGISGTVRVVNCVTWIGSLSFQTNKNNHGPYGTNNGTSFSLQVADGRFAGFFGNFRDNYLDSFGFILQDCE